MLEEHQQALALYSRHSTQWRTGAAGATGLDYNVLYQAMERMELPNARQLELIDEIGLIEAGILAGWAERRERDKGDK